MWAKVTAIVAVVGVLLGGISWVIEIHSLAEANARELNIVREYHKTIRSIDIRLSRIEGALGVLGD